VCVYSFNSSKDGRPSFNLVATSSLFPFLPFCTWFSKDSDPCFPLSAPPAEDNLYEALDVGKELTSYGTLDGRSQALRQIGTELETETPTLLLLLSFLFTTFKAFFWRLEKVEKAGWWIRWDWRIMIEHKSFEKWALSPSSQSAFSQYIKSYVWNYWLMNRLLLWRERERGRKWNPVIKSRKPRRITSAFSFWGHLRLFFYLPFHNGSKPITPFIFWRVSELSTLPKVNEAIMVLTQDGPK